MAVDFWRGILYAVNRGDDTVSAYRIRPNGRLVPLAVSNAGIMPYGIAIDPFGRFLYVTNIDQPNPEPFGPVSGRASGEFLYAQTGQAISVYRIAGNGNLIPVGLPFQLGFSPHAIVAAPARELILEEAP